MPRGGRRNGKPGQAYGNRSDLNAPKPPATQFTGQPYGAATQQAAAQQAMPVAGTAVPLPQPGAPGQPPALTGPAPGSLGDLHRPTDRPNEPVTAGLASGPGPGPEALGLGNHAPMPMDPVTQQIYALYRKYPIQEIADLLS